MSKPNMKDCLKKIDNAFHAIKRQNPHLSTSGIMRDINIKDMGFDEEPALTTWSAACRVYEKQTQQIQNMKAAQL
jgi:hypothetical protein